MIAGNTDNGANQGGEVGENMFTECCNLNDGDEDCEEWGQLKFPRRNCDFLGIAFNMPTCWNGENDSDNHRDHMAFTADGRVDGACPSGFDRRLPQVQVFVRIMNYKGKKFRYQLSDGKNDEWHVDFFGGWKKGKLENIIENCEVTDEEDTGFNPPCTCEEFLTENKNVAKTMCESDVKQLIINESTERTKSLPRGTCEGPNLEAKSWDKLTNSVFTCKNGASCREYKNDTFYHNGKKMTCKWLRKQKKTGKKWKKICQNENGTGGFDARIVCPKTCVSCD